MPLELVLLVPVLVLLTLFVLWAGRGGRAGLTADLAAEEAATAAALCCEEGQAFESDRDALVADLLAARPGLQFLCIGGLRPAADPDTPGAEAEFVQEHWLEFEPGASSGGVGVLGVRFACETDGAVAPLRGLFPTVTFHGQAAEVVVRRPPPPGIGFGSPRFVVTEGAAQLKFVVTSDEPVSDDVVVRYEVVAANTTASVGTGPPDDYQDLGTPPLEQTISAGRDSTEIVVTLFDDSVYEGPETLELELLGLYDTSGNLLNSSVAEIDAHRDTAVGRIEDDELQPYLSLHSVTSPCQVGEADTTLSFEVRLRDQNNNQAPNATAVTVDVDTEVTGTGDGHASAPKDFTALTGNTVTFASGDAAPKTVTVTIKDDASSPEGEPDETFRVKLLSPSGAPLATISPTEVTCTIIDDEVEVTADDAEVDEGGQLKFELMLDGSPTGDIQVGFELVEHQTGTDKATRGTACTSGIDYLRSSGDIIIPSSHNPSLKVTSIPEFTTCADRIVERAETLWLRIWVVSGEAWVDAGDDGAVGTIRNDDVPVVSVRPLNPQGTEGGTVRLTVTLDDGSGGGLQLTQGVTAGYAVAGRGTSPATDPGSTGADYALKRSNAAIPLTGTVAFVAGLSATVQQEVFDFELLADYLAEPSESLRLDLSIQTDPMGEAVFEDRDNDPLTDDSYADVTILDDPPPALSVSDFSGDEGTDQVFAVTLANRRAGDTVTVDYTVGGGTDTATAPPAALHDYTAAPNYTPSDPLSGTITFSGAKTVHNLGVRLERDTVYEVDETLSITLSNQSSNAVLADATGEGTIVDADAPRLVVSSVDPLKLVDPLKVKEGEVLTFTVTLCSPISGEDASVDYATRALSAKAGLDFTATSGNLKFLDTDPLDSQVPALCGTGRTSSKSKRVSVATIRDGIAENDEEVHLVLSNRAPSHVALGKAVGVGMIVNLNPAIVRVNNPSATEGDPLAFEITLVDDGYPAVLGTGDLMWIYWATNDGTAAEGSDYKSVPDTAAPCRVAPWNDSSCPWRIFDASGNPTQADPDPASRRLAVPVDTLVDAIVEADETMVLRLYPFYFSGTVLGDSEGTGTIVDSPPPYVRIDSPAAVDEGATARFTVGLYDADGALTTASETVTVNYVTADGTATAGSDYTAVSASTLTFSAGDQEKTIDVVTLTDSAAEPAETFRVNLSSPVNAILDKAVGVGTIKENLKPGLSVADASTRAGGTALFKVTLAPATASTVTVNFATSDGTATAGSDYTARSGTLTFSPGETAKTVGVLTTQDSDTGDETFNMVLSGAANADLDDDTGVGTIKPVTGSTLSIADASGPENAVMQFDVTLSPAASQTVTVDYATKQRTVLGAATEGSDYQRASGTLTFAAGDTAKTVNVAIEDDNVAEFDETFLVELSNPSGAVIADGTSVGTIDGTASCIKRGGSETMPDPPSVAGISASEGAGEMTPTISIKVTEAMCEDYIFQFEVTADARPGKRNSATLGADFLQPKPVTLAVGQTSVGFSVPLIDDDVVEGPETFKLRVWSKRLPGLRNLTDVEVYPTIVDDDTAQLQLPADGTVTVAEGGWLSFVITLDRPSNTDVTFDYATSDGSSPSATAGADYTAVSGTATISAGDLSVTVAVRTLQDTLDEHDENVDLTVSNLSGATVGTGGDTATGVITDDDAPPAMSVGDATAVEGEDLQFTVTLDAPSGREVTVKRQTYDGSAEAADDDYEPLTLTVGEVVIAAGATSQTVPVQAKTDDVVENTESMFLELKNPDGATLDDAIGTGRIVDGTLRRTSVSDASVTEGGTLVFRVSIADANYNRDITVSYQTTADSAVAGVDYSDAFESPVSKELKILAGDTSATVLVPTLQDSLDEAVESLDLVLSAVEGGGAVIVDGTAGGVIVDDDPEPRLRVSDTSATEAAGAKATFTLSLSEASGRDVTVAYRTRDGVGDDAAEAGKDYTAVPSGTVTIAAGDRQATVDVALVNDSVAEKVEKFRLEVTAAVNASIDDSVGWATVIDDDGLIQILVDDAGDVYEGPNAAATFTVRLSRPDSARAVTVNYATEDGTATAGADYTAASGTLTFATGEVSKTVTVAVLEDSVKESAETFRLKLSSPSDNAEVGDDTAVALILDADSRPTVSVADAPAVAEGSTASFAVSLSRSSVRAATVAYATRADPTAPAETGAAADLDYTATAGTLTIPARSTAATVTVPLLDDSFDEHTETFWLRLSSPTAATVLDGTAVGTINDNDPLPSLEILDASADEGSTLSFEVRLSAVSGRSVSVPWATRALSPGPKAATTGTDYTAASGTATFASTATTATVTVASLSDNVSEQDEQFLVQLGTPVNAVLDDGAAVGAIVDDDSLPRISIADASADEDAGPVVFNVALSRASGQLVTVAYAVADGTATDPEDYNPGTDSTLAIPAGDVRGQISVAVVEDDVGESTETFTITLSNPVNAVIAGGAGTATGTILDDEGPPRLTIGDAEECEDGSSPGDCEVRACRVIRHRTWEPGRRWLDSDYCEKHILTSDACPPGQCAGNGTIEFPVELSHAAAEDTSVRYTTFVGEAASPRDYTATAARLTIPAGDTTASIVIALTNDGIDEPPTETFRLVLDDPDGVELDDTEAVGTILDDDLAPVVPAASSDAWANEDDGFIYHRITLSRPSGRTVTVDYWFGSVVYYPAVEKSGFSYYLDCTDHPEGPGIQFTCAKLKEWINQTGCDYPYQRYMQISCQRGALFDGGTLTFAPGVVEQVIAVPLTDNFLATVHPDDSVYPYSNVSYDLNFDNRVNATRSANGRGRVWDDDTPPYVDNIAAADGVAESAGEAVFTINLNRVDDEDVTVTYATEDGTATAGSDYTAVDSTVTIPKGTTSATVSVAITGDSAVEDDETFTLKILDDSRNRNLTYLAAPLENGQGDGSATMTIIDDDTTPKVSVADIEVYEYVGTARFRVTLDRISADDVTVDYATADGTATAGSDYTSASGTLTVPAASTGASVDVTINQDTSTESSETFTLSLSNVVGATVAEGSATATILDDDTTPEVSIADTLVREEQWWMPFWVSLSRASSRDVTVDYATADGTAVAGVDYWSKSGTLTIPARTTGASLTVGIIQDSVSEGDETFTLSLSNPSGATIADGSATATITEDTDTPTLTVADLLVSENTAESGSPTISLPSLLDSLASREVTVDWQVVETPELGDGAAIRGVDFETKGEGTFRISMGQVNSWIRAGDILPDDVVERDEKFLVVLSNPVGATLARTRAWVTIVNDDLPTVSVADASASESGDSVDFTLTLDQPGLNAGRIDYTTVVRSSQGDRAAKPGEDYTSASGTVRFAAGATAATVSVPLIGDAADEYDETFLLVLSNPDTLRFSDSVAVGTITDDDDGWWIVEDRSVWENAAKMTFTVERDHTSSASASVSYRIVSGASAVGGTSCSDGVDFVWPSGSSTGSVTMAATVQTATLEVTVCDDAETEGKENLALELTGVSSRRPSAIGTILDND